MITHQQPTTKNQSLLIPEPEITCKSCSGLMEILQTNEMQIIPSSSILVCKSCGDIQEIYFEGKFLNRINQKFGKKQSVCPLCHQLTSIEF